MLCEFWQAHFALMRYKTNVIITYDFVVHKSRRKNIVFAKEGWNPIDNDPYEPYHTISFNKSTHHICCSSDECCDNNYSNLHFFNFINKYFWIVNWNWYLNILLFMYLWILFSGKPDPTTTIVKIFMTASMAGTRENPSFETSEDLRANVVTKSQGTFTSVKSTGTI